MRNCILCSLQKFAVWEQWIMPISQLKWKVITIWFPVLYSQYCIAKYSALRHSLFENIVMNKIGSMYIRVYYLYTPICIYKSRIRTNLKNILLSTSFGRSYWCHYIWMLWSIFQNKLINESVDKLNLFFKDTSLYFVIYYVLFIKYQTFY